jgi:hypothetical protein
MSCCSFWNALCAPLRSPDCSALASDAMSDLIGPAAPERLAAVELAAPPNRPGWSCCNAANADCAADKSPAFNALARSLKSARNEPAPLALFEEQALELEGMPEIDMFTSRFGC